MGELLAARLDGVDGESAGGQAVDVVAPEGAEVARAQEDDDLVVVLRPLQRIVDADTGVPDVGRDAIREGVLAVVEEAGGEGQGFYTATAGLGCAQSYLLTQASK